MLHRGPLLVCLAALVAPTLLPDRATGQEIDSPYRFIETRHAFSLYGGQFFSEEGQTRLGAQSGPAAGFRYDIRISGPFNFDAGATVFPTKHAVLDSLIVPGDTQFVQVGEADLLLGVLDAGIRFDLTGPRTWHRLTPYVVAGVGVVFTLSSDDEASESLEEELRYDPGTSFAGEIGAGVEWFLTDRLTLRGEVRDYLWRIEAPRIYPLLDNELPGNEWLQNASLTLGIGLRL